MALFLCLVLVIFPLLVASDVVRRVRIDVDENSRLKAKVAKSKSNVGLYSEAVRHIEDSRITINITRLKVDPLDSSKVSPPCKGICADIAKGGILLLGDSPVRRLYIRLLARIEGLTDAASEMLQNSAKVGAHKAANAGLGKFRDETGEPLFDYNKGGMRIRHASDNHYNLDSIAAALKAAAADNFRYVFYGLPTTHLLYYPELTTSRTMSCAYGQQFPTEFSKRFEEIVGFAEKFQAGRVIFGNGPPFAKREPFNCTPQSKQLCQEGICDWLQDNNGVQKANVLIKQCFTKSAKPFMRHADTHNAVVTSGLDLPMYGDGGVHYTYPILDLQLDTIFQSSK